MKNNVILRKKILSVEEFLHMSEGMVITYYNAHIAKYGISPIKKENVVFIRMIKGTNQMTISLKVDADESLVYTVNYNTVNGKTTSTVYQKLNNVLTEVKH